MPRRNDISSILLIGSGPIVIGQACEFDYSGTQACKALKEEGFRVILVNSNPATIMTDPGLVDATYIEPIRLPVLERIISQERPDALLPTMGGQTALNMAMKLDEAGILKKYEVELIGADIEAIQKAENRELFRASMEKLGIPMPMSRVVHSVAEALDVAEQIEYPLIIRPSFTLGGEGGGVATDQEELIQIATNGLSASPTQEILVEQSILGWKEFEMEVMRDHSDNCVIICSIENFDPMGVHTGDSITVAPSQTLTDVEYQQLRDMSFQIMREIGVDTGGSNVQFAINPRDGQVMVIEMNPRVSRSSALASKATGFPIAKIAAKLAVGYTLDEIPNDITKKTPASFEPSIDYVVTKIPRFTFEKFPLSDPRLGTQMKSVGEAMAIGSTFRESLQKALRSLETGHIGLDPQIYPKDRDLDEVFEEELSRVTSQRLWFVADALRAGWSVERLHQKTFIDPWFLMQMQSLIQEEIKIAQQSVDQVTRTDLLRWKSLGFSDALLAKKFQVPEAEVAKLRRSMGLRPVFKMVDTCAAEFPSETPYFYSTYAQENESIPTDRPKVLILGSGPNRIGQGIEFDYCCVHAALAVREYGYEAIMYNCNPETVSTDYDTSDRLYFEPLTFEDVMHVIELEKPIGVIVQLGGQTPLKLAKPLHDAGVQLLGTDFESIDRAEDRELFAAMLNKLGLQQPANGTARSLEEAREIAERIGYPILVRPSYVLGGRAMVVVESEDRLEEFFAEAIKVSPDHPVLIDQFLSNAVEIDVDLLGDGEEAEVAGIMEHIERAGIHSGDSACSLPPFGLGQDILEELCIQAKSMAQELKVCGLMNVQFAVKEKDVYVIEVNPRASRTVPFVSKAIGVPLAKYATRLMLGEKLSSLGFEYHAPTEYAVKETVFPFMRFTGSDTTLGPEMLSTGEVMGRGTNFEEAFLKAQMAVFEDSLNRPYVFIGVMDEDKPKMVIVAKMLEEMGYEILSTRGTFQVLKDQGVQRIQITSMDASEEGNIIEYILRKEVALLINTTRRRKRAVGARHIRRLVLAYNLPYFTTSEAAVQFTKSLHQLRSLENLNYQPLPFPVAKGA
ncbi:MAG: carbamoyl-phosphate synthase large subunit [bacterium]